MPPSALVTSNARSNSAADTAGGIIEMVYSGNESLIGLQLSLIVNVLLLP